MLLADVAMGIAGNASGTDELARTTSDYRACFDGMRADWPHYAFPHWPARLGLRRLSGLP